jgi:hypothetical protein
MMKMDKDFLPDAKPFLPRSVAPPRPQAQCRQASLSRVCYTGRSKRCEHAEQSE